MGVAGGSERTCAATGRALRGWLGSRRGAAGSWARSWRRPRRRGRAAAAAARRVAVRRRAPACARPRPTADAADGGCRGRRRLSRVVCLFSRPCFLPLSPGLCTRPLAGCSCSCRGSPRCCRPARLRWTSGCTCSSARSPPSDGRVGTRLCEDGPSFHPHPPPLFFFFFPCSLLLGRSACFVLFFYVWCFFSPLCFVRRCRAVPFYQRRLPWPVRYCST